MQFAKPAWSSRDQCLLWFHWLRADIKEYPVVLREFLKKFEGFADFPITELAPQYRSALVSEMLYLMEMKIKLWISKHLADVKLLSGYSGDLQSILCSAELQPIGSYDLFSRNNFKSDITVLTDFYKKQLSHSAYTIWFCVSFVLKLF